MKIKRFGDFYKQESIIDDFLSSLNESSGGDVNEILKRFKEEFKDVTPTKTQFAEFYHKLRSEGFDGTEIFDILDDYIPKDDEENSDDFEDQKESTYKSIEKKVISDLKLDSKLVLTFGAGIGALYPVVLEMMQNMSISVDVSKQTVVLLTIAAITITYLEEKKFKTPEEEDILTKDSKSMLEELRMQGIGDGIVKKVIKALNGIKNIFSTIGKHLGAAVGGIIDMFAYTAILIPVMNAILAVIGMHEMSVDDVISNFFSLSMGVATRIAKHGLVEILDRLRRFISPSSKREILDDLETPVIQKFGDFTHGDTESEQEGDLIKEQ
jgi:hypothetical protein